MLGLLAGLFSLPSTSPDQTPSCCVYSQPRRKHVSHTHPLALAIFRWLPRLPLPFDKPELYSVFLDLVRLVAGRLWWSGIQDSS